MLFVNIPNFPKLLLDLFLVLLNPPKGAKATIYSGHISLDFVSRSWSGTLEFNTFSICICRSYSSKVFKALTGKSAPFWRIRNQSWWNWSARMKNCPSWMKIRKKCWQTRWFPYRTRKCFIRLKFNFILLDSFQSSA